MAKRDHSLVSTSALAKQLELPTRRVFELLVDKGWIERVGEHWKLTGKGQFEGGDYVTSKKFGEYIGWPETVLEHSIFAELFKRPMRTRVLGSELGISAHRFNALLVELGWQKRHHRGWILTELGRSLGGTEQEDDESGVPFTLWPRATLDNEQLQTVLGRIAFEIKSPNQQETDKTGNDQQSLDFNAADSGHADALDGHQPTHPEDRALCNWFYLMNVNHAYHRELPDNSLGHCDFYLPSAQLYIESWHAADSGKALAEKLRRIDYYQQQKLSYIEIGAEQLAELDTVLPKLLLKHGITVY